MRRGLAVLLVAAGCFAEPDADSADTGTSAASTGAEGDGATSAGPGATQSDDGADPSTSGADGTGDDDAVDGSTAGGSDMGDSDADGDGGSGSGGTVDACGNGMLDEGELCDNGPLNGTAQGDCSPDCSAVVAQRLVWLSNPAQFENTPGNVIAEADAACVVLDAPEGAALFGYADVRRPPTIDGSVTAIDWPLTPWTRYLRAEDGQLIWLTDATPLWGVRDGVQQELERTPATFFQGIITGLTQAWEVAPQCGDWTSHDSSSTLLSGISNTTTIEFLARNDPVQTCDNLFSYYCVEVGGP